MKTVKHTQLGIQRLDFAAEAVSGNGVGYPAKPPASFSLGLGGVFSGLGWIQALARAGKKIGTRRNTGSWQKVDACAAPLKFMHYLIIYFKRLVIIKTLGSHKNNLALVGEVWANGHDFLQVGIMTGYRQIINGRGDRQWTAGGGTGTMSWRVNLLDKREHSYFSGNFLIFP